MSYSSRLLADTLHMERPCRITIAIGVGGEQRVQAQYDRLAGRLYL